ncbi:MAG: aminotransferase class I/II-fold pyridoxal phosphate-dependent enzyme [SAR202 cluster bacterium]|jgi:threonine aldolase|nr:aminotransferase class I/II-fold pyridoxal phosphate-dependent enzyme [SAR202 cluster bacterium]MDP6511975.1 aminotransferase class I/II-fold pyridoxal phosphate-dependent enzyme [SAR202 cluster bacterium]MDP6716802.1 aminotransferase class I/II-fold pyridoxal phosphate-dependent enzyme [SAR202 cluster bacterium]
MNVSDTQKPKPEYTTASQRQPNDSATSVVFSGDGEPKTPDSMLSKLVTIQQNGGIASDTYTLGGVVEELEQRMARELGKEAAVFMPTGTLGNHLALRRLCGLKPRAVVQEQSHLYNDTGDCVQQLSGIHMVPLAQDEAFFTMSQLEAAVTRSETGRVSNSVGSMMIESPVRRQGGQVMPLEEMKEMTDFCSEHDIGSHLDGARLYMMCGASGVNPKEYSALFDTVYVSMYKYFGAPFGAILAGTEEFCEGLYHDRRMFGSGLSSSAFAAALALDGIDGFEERFALAMSQGRILFDRLNEIGGIQVEQYENGSNIFPLTLDASIDIDIDALADRLRESWIFIPTTPDDYGRHHLTVNTTLLRQSNDEIVTAFREALS